MLNKVRIFWFIITFTLTSGICNAKELNLIKDRTYILNFDEEIQNFHTSSTSLEAQILHTIFNDKRQIILSLKDNKPAYLQVKTEKNLFNYEIKNATKPSRELIEIDFPSIENLNVDIYNGEK